MGVIALDATALILVGFGALLAGFTTGLTGFGTGLVASGVWFHVLPPETVPPLVALSSVAAQLVGLIAVRKAFDWRRAWPFLAGGAADAISQMAAQPACEQGRDHPDAKDQPDERFVTADLGDAQRQQERHAVGCRMRHCQRTDERQIPPVQYAGSDQSIGGPLLKGWIQENIQFD